MLELSMEDVRSQENIANKNPIFDEVIKIVNTQDSNSRIQLIDSFTDRRLSEMSLYNEKYFPSNDPLVNTFIGTDTIIKPNQWSIRGYRFNDSDFTYKYPLTVLTEINKSTPINQDNYSGVLLSTTFRSIVDYFGNVYASSDQIKKRDNLLNKNSDLDFDNANEMKIASISVFRGENCGICMEKAIFTHNLLLLLGIKDSIATGNIYLTDIENKQIENSNDRHVFNIVTKDNGAQFIVDCTLAVSNMNSETKKIKYSPLVSPLTPEQKNDLYGKKPTSVDYKSNIPNQKIKKIVYQLD